MRTPVSWAPKQVLLLTIKVKFPLRDNGCLQCGLTNHIREISRFANTKNSCLDHIYSNCNIVNECGTLNVSISDHVPVFLNRKKGKFLQEKVNFTGRSYRNYN